MMTGYLQNLHLMLPVTLRLPNQPDINIDFVIDTGFTGFLTLPMTAVAARGLSFLHRISADLADGSTVYYDVYSATIWWNGSERIVRIIAMGRRPLLGTALLEDFELLAQFRDNGLLTVDEI